MSWLEGGCHCGRVRFRARLVERKALDCNCSICTKKGFLHAIVASEDFDQRARHRLHAVCFPLGLPEEPLDLLHTLVRDDPSAGRESLGS